MNTINRYRAGKRSFANLFQAIDHATAIGCDVKDGTTGLTVWRNPNR